MEILLENGASVEARNNNKETPIQCAANSKVGNFFIFIFGGSIDLTPFESNRSCSINSSSIPGKMFDTLENPAEQAFEQFDVHHMFLCQNALCYNQFLLASGHFLRVFLIYQIFCDGASLIRIQCILPSFLLTFYIMCILKNAIFSSKDSHRLTKAF